MIRKNSYRIGVGIILINDKKKIFVGKRIDVQKDSWQMPQGGINKEENFEDAAFRELYEETGIQKAKIIIKSKKWFKYKIPSSLNKKLWNNKYTGQKQKWFVMKFEGNEKKDINLNIHKPEFNEWKWVNLDSLENLIVSFKKEMYKKLIQEFGQKIKNLN